MLCIVLRLLRFMGLWRIVLVVVLMIDVVDYGLISVWDIVNDVKLLEWYILGVLVNSSV